ncbi:MAG: phosphoribosylaminoimidazolesuccinocarboxamide synthase [Planctomycetota bacterium]
MLQGLTHLRSGKVRDIYELEGNLLIVASDRISAFDWVLEDPIPGKGKLLTEISLHWFKLLEGIVRNHLITADVDEMPEAARRNRDALAGRSMYVRKASVVPVECIVRGYLTGSGYKDYFRTGSVCGIPLPSGLRDSDKLPEPLFTPSTKAEVGHDENISEAEAVAIAGADVVAKLKDLSLRMYTTAADYALSKGIIIADTKFEFGILPDGDMIVVDEVLTPDSSRFWPLDQYAPGKPQPSFDKQFVRDYLLTCGWDRNSPPPRLPQAIVEKTLEKYKQARDLLVG